MKTISTRATVTKDGIMLIPVPPNIGEGEHDVVVIVDEQPTNHQEALQPIELPLHDLGPWPPGLSLRREDMYDERGR